MQENVRHLRYTGNRVTLPKIQQRMERNIISHVKYQWVQNVYSRGLQRASYHKHHVRMQVRTFDVIIVGDGTAGCVLASRLSADPDLQVLLLEAGADRNDNPKVLIPLTSRRMFSDSGYDWCLTSTPQERLHGRVFGHTRGRMLGGSSGINSHSLVYPSRAMNDCWASIAGERRWSWVHMEPYSHRFRSTQVPDPGDVDGTSQGPI